MKFSIIVLLVLLGLVALFTVQNPEVVTVRFLGFAGNTLLLVVIVSSFAAGVFGAGARRDTGVLPPAEGSEGGEAEDPGAGGGGGAPQDRGAKAPGGREARAPEAGGRLVKGLSARLASIHRRLASHFGTPEPSPHETSPVWNLVLTILSQNTTDANRDRAFSSLKDRFSSFSRLAAADPGEVEDAIRPAGLAKAKAAAILSALSRLEKERGGYTLDFLRSMPLEDARAFLTSFGGVGVKTANILLLFSFGFPAFPVDTHVFRVTKRLGLIPPATSPAKAALFLEPHVPAGTHVPLHLNLIRLGRQICRPRNPLCPSCPLLEVCPTGAKRIAEGSPS